MKSRRKIWSLPLVFVTALLLVGLFGAAVLAQTDEPSVVNDDVRVAIDGDADSLSSATIATVNIEDLPTEGVKAFVNLVEDDEDTDTEEEVTSPSILNNPTVDHDDDSESARIDVFTIEGTIATGRRHCRFRKCLSTRASMPDDLTRDSYTLRIRAFVDKDTGADSGGDDVDDNDRDYTFNATVTVYVVTLEDDGTAGSMLIRAKR